MKQTKRGIHELYNDDPVTADELVWGRKSDPLTRRGFLKNGGLAAMSAAVGASIPFAHLMPGGLIPAALAQTDEPFEIPGKEGLIVLNDRPINAETPAHLLDDRVTPAKYLFVRNNGREPALPGIDPAAWTLEIGGESAERTASFSIGELKERSSITPTSCRSSAAATAAANSCHLPAATSGRWAPWAARSGPACA